MENKILDDLKYTCPFCDIDLTSSSIYIRQIHIESCLMTANEDLKKSEVVLPQVKEEKSCLNFLRKNRARKNGESSAIKSLKNRKRENKSKKFINKENIQISPKSSREDIKLSLLTHLNIQQTELKNRKNQKEIWNNSKSFDKKIKIKNFPLKIVDDNKFFSEEVSKFYISLIDNDTVSDLKIKCRGGIMINAHKFIVFNRCSLLKELIDNSNVINLDRFSKGVIIAILKYAYAGIVEFFIDDFLQVFDLASICGCEKFIEFLNKINEERINYFTSKVEESQENTKDFAIIHSENAHKFSNSIDFTHNNSELLSSFRDISVYPSESHPNNSFEPLKNMTVVEEKNSDSFDEFNDLNLKNSISRKSLTLNTETKNNFKIVKSLISFTYENNDLKRSESKTINNSEPFSKNDNSKILSDLDVIDDKICFNQNSLFDSPKIFQSSSIVIECNNNSQKFSDIIMDDRTPSFKCEFHEKNKSICDIDEDVSDNLKKYPEISNNILTALESEICVLDDCKNFQNIIEHGISENNYENTNIDTSCLNNDDDELINYYQKYLSANITENNIAILNQPQESESVSLPKPMIKISKNKGDINTDIEPKKTFDCLADNIKEMNTPALKNAVKKFGLKPMCKNKMICILKEIEQNIPQKNVLNLEKKNKLNAVAPSNIDEKLLVQLIREDKKLISQIISFEPVDIKEIQIFLNTRGVNLNKKYIRSFLDSQSITYFLMKKKKS